MERFPRAFGKFFLKRRLARGGMADVFLATMSGAEGFEKELVVKLIRPELAADEAFVRRFVDEAKTCVRLTHPNIVSIFELGVETGILYLVMELVRGCTLAELLNAGGALTAEEGAYVALEVARALDHAHRRGVVHRDVTPGNVMIDEEGSVKLLDFGVAARAGEIGDVEVFGTPGHMPPEQIEGKPLSGTADLFALGTVMIEAWTARAPFRRGDARASKTAMLDAPALPSATNTELAALDELVKSLVALDPAHRPQHADDVARVLRRYLRERGADLDEVARGLRARVAKGAAAREAREQGRPMPAAIAKTHRPTPLGEVTRTFATRGTVDAWHGPSTRKVEDAAPDSLDRPSVTRKIEDAPAPAEPAAKRSRAPFVVAAIVAVGVAGAFVVPGWLRARIQEGPVPGSQASVSSGRAPVPGSQASVSSGRAPVPGSQASVSSGQAPVPGSQASVSSGQAPVPGSQASVSSGQAPVPGSQASVSSGQAPVPPAPSSVDASSAHVMVSSSPPASVEVDGAGKGTTPVELRLPCGEHRIVLRPKGLGEAVERRIHLCPSGASVHGDFNDEPIVSIGVIPK